jgi:hypothetical protein
MVSNSMPAIGEIDPPLIAAPQVMAHPGANPTVTVPVVAGHSPDVAALWSHLAEPAEFFGFAMPPPAHLADAIALFIDSAVAATKLFALNVTIVERGGATHFAVAGSEVQSTRRDVVRLDACDAPLPLTRTTDPWWRRMAARTTSKAEVDQFRRWLEGRGYVDAVSSAPAPGAPVLGALVFVGDGDVRGVDHAEPTSILTQLQECGAIGPMRRVDECPVAAQHVWWISPGYECHPVAAIGARSYPVDESAVPPFARMP